MSKKKEEKTARRAIELFKDRRFGQRIIKSKKAYDRNKDKRVVNETESLTPVSSISSSSIQIYDPILPIMKKKLKRFSMFKRKPV